MKDKKKKRKSPIIALVLSGLLPGLGQIYNNQLVKGLVLIGLNFVISLLIREPLSRLMELEGDPFADEPTTLIVLAYTLAGLALVIFSMIDAKKTADKLNRSDGL